MHGLQALAVKVVQNPQSDRSQIANSLMKRLGIVAQSLYFFVCRLIKVNNIRFARTLGRTAIVLLTCKRTWLAADVHSAVLAEGFAYGSAVEHIVGQMLSTLDDGIVDRWVDPNEAGLESNQPN